MYLAYRWISRDLGRGEVIISILLISVFLGVMVSRSLVLFASVERRLVETTIVNMQTALQLQAAIQSLGDLHEGLQIREGMNPVDLVQPLPDDYEKYLDTSLGQLRAKQFSVRPLENYLGEFYDPDIETLEKGNWYFDHNGKVLVYLIEHSDFFGNNETTLTGLRYSVQLDYTDVNNNRRYEPGIDSLKSASLVNISTNQ